MTGLRDIYQEVKVALSDYGVEAASLEAKRLIFSVLSLSEETLITAPDSAIEEVEEVRIRDILNQRLAGKPLTKILGQAEFWGLPFYTSEHTLDPRPDTEILVETALKYARSLETDHLKILDLGTGTGCVLISLLSELPSAEGVTVDISAEAIEIARKNAVLNNVANRFYPLQGSWMDAIEGESFDIIISNPPYIRDEVIPDLTPEVKNHDPILALSGGKNGLDAYEKILNHIKNGKEGTERIFLEIGFDQENDILRLVDDSNLCHCDSVRDYQGHVRVVEICSGDK